MSALASERLLSPAQAARAIGLSRYFVVRAVDEGRVPAVLTPGGHRRVRLTDVRREFPLTSALR